MEDASATIQEAAEQGAHAVELNLPAISDITNGELQALIDKSPIPIYTTCRRAPFMTVYGFALETLPAWSDDKRMEQQLAAIHTGSVAIDIEMDTFDPHPAPPLGTPDSLAFAATPGSAAELSHNRVALSRQREVIAEAHTAGAEVILSCHTGRPQSTEQLVQVAHDAAARGGDLLKIVTPCRHSKDLVALLDATARIQDTLPIPFIMVGAGEPAGSAGSPAPSSDRVGQSLRQNANPVALPSSQRSLKPGP